MSRAHTSRTHTSRARTSNVVLDLSPSLDGYLAGEGVSVQAPFGDAGHRLHRWLGFEGTQPEPADDEAARRMLADAGAVVLGRRMYEVGIGHWGEDGAWGRPCFVVTRRAHAPVLRGPTRFEFVTDGVQAAVARARAAAGGREVVVAGGAEVARQCLAAGLVDAMRLHLVPVLLGRGTRLFDGVAADGFRPLRAVATANAVHADFERLAGRS